MRTRRRVLAALHLAATHGAGLEFPLTAGTTELWLQFTGKPGGSRWAARVKPAEGSWWPSSEIETEVLFWAEGVLTVAVVDALLAESGGPGLLFECELFQRSRHHLVGSPGDFPGDLVGLSAGGACLPSGPLRGRTGVATADQVGEDAAGACSAWHCGAR